MSITTLQCQEIRINISTKISKFNREDINAERNSYHAGKLAEQQPTDRPKKKINNKKVEGSSPYNMKVHVSDTVFADIEGERRINQQLIPLAV